MKIFFGYTLFILSWLAWGVIAVLPLLDISVSEATAITTGLLIAGEVFFFSSMALLGKEVINKVKNFFNKKDDSPSSS